MAFTHLQVRSGYSLMSSTITINKLVEKAHNLHFPALALTDDQVLYGTIPFYKACLNKGIKPIIGMIVHVREEEEENDCILLAKNNQGYQALVQLSTAIQTKGIKTIEKERLARFTADLIGILPALDSKVAKILLEKTHEDANSYIQSWTKLFHADDFYLGVHNFGSEEDNSLIPMLKTFCVKYAVKAAAVNDVRYLNRKDKFAFDCLQAMKQQRKWSIQTTDSSFKEHFLRSEKEMEDLFSDWPDALAATEQITKVCDVTFDFEKRMIPSFPVPEQMDAHAYLEEICMEQLKQKYQAVTENIQRRLSYELDVIKSMQFSDYFLIVADFVKFAKNNQIAVGPGRGSAAGSIVAYVLDITEVDPVKYHLLFERFLNPERITMPDIDIDIADNRRDEVIAYVRNKYGQDHVAQIITFGTFAARSVVRELIKVMEIDKPDEQFILSHIPVQAQQPLVAYVQDSDELKQYMTQSKKIKLLFAAAIVLEGLPRHISTHAAGVVISDKPLVEHVPLTIGANETSLTQFPMGDLEAIGLLKMDFLGLRNLTLLERIVKQIYFTEKQVIDLTKIPENDPKTFALLQKGKTNGVFQLESAGMKQVLKRLQPTEFEDIVAVNALYRPGPMDNIPVYIARKHKQKAITYPHPDLESILKKTYGVLIYQEQIMQIAHKIARFTLGQADILRRAVSKKQKHLMDEQKDAFIQGCMANGYEQSIAEQIFDWIVQFSNYGFNRSHAVAYSFIAYQLAYLKANFPACFFAELLSSAVNQQEKVNQYIKEAQEFNLEVLPPSINDSFGRFSVNAEGIRMGLSSIKGIGQQLIKEILAKRSDRPFANIFDFCMRIPSKINNRKTMEILIMAGVFDKTNSNRATLLASIDKALEQSELFREFDNQTSFFQDELELEASYIEMEDMPVMDKLGMEKELLGIYVSSHPLKGRRTKLAENGYGTLKDAHRQAGTRNVKTAGIIQSMKIIRTKRGDPMAFMTVGDETDELEVVVFPELFREIRFALNEGETICIAGKMEERNNRIQMLLSSAESFAEANKSFRNPERLFIKVSEQNSENALVKVAELVQKYPGGTPIIIYTMETKKTYQLSKRYYIDLTQNCLREFEIYFGAENIAVKNKK